MSRCFITDSKTVVSYPFNINMYLHLYGKGKTQYTYSVFCLFLFWNSQSSFSCLILSLLGVLPW